MRDGGGFEPVRDAELAQDVRDGMSEAPLEPEHYADGQLWADVAAVIEQLRLTRRVRD